MSAKGVGPLVCAVCEKTVGAINMSALIEMLQTDDIYICHDCDAAFPEVMIETALGQQHPGHYAEVVNKVQLVWAAVS